MNTAPGIDPEMLRKYLETRKAVAKRAERICNLAYILSLLEHCDDDVIPVSPQVLASFADQINSDVCSITEQLDTFLYILDAEKTLSDSGK